MNRAIVLLILLFLISCPTAGYTAEPLPPEGFIKITENLLNALNSLEDEARDSTFKQLNNPIVQDRFNRVSATLKKYEARSSGTVHSWPEGQQKKIVTKLQAANFHYRAYSMSQSLDYRKSGEKSLQSARDLFRVYRNTVEAGK